MCTITPLDPNLKKNIQRTILTNLNLKKSLNTQKPDFGMGSPVLYCFRQK